MTSPLDVVLLVLDTQRVDRLSCYGYSQGITPRLDELAAESTQFTQAIAPAHWTVPSHASMFTGLYPSQHTVYQMDSVLSPELPSLAQRLWQAGYYTAGCSHNPLIGMAQNGLQRGFQSFRNYNYLGAGLLTSHLSQANAKSNSSTKLRRKLRVLLAEVLGYSQQTPLHNVSPLTLPFWRAALKLKGDSKTANIQQSLAAASQLLIERRGTGRNQPIFVFINLMGTHVPYAPPQWAREAFLSHRFGRRSANEILQFANGWQVDVANWLAMKQLTDEHKAMLDAVYDAEVAAQDAQIGEFIDRLRTAGKLDNILLIITADHGDHLGEKQRLNHVFGVHQELTHVPLLIRDPSGDLPRSVTVDRFVSTRRLFHTALTAARAATAEEEAFTLARVNDGDYSRGAEGVVFAEAQPLQWGIQRVEKRRPGLVHEYGYDRPYTAVYSGSYKLIAEAEQPIGLYAVRHDPIESTDLRQQRPEQVKELKRQLQDFRQRMHPSAQSITQSEMDPQVLEQLRALGYVE